MDPQDLSAVERWQNPSDAEDLAQETLLRAYSKLGSYDPAHPFLTWLFRIAHNRAVDLLRRRRPEELPLEVLGIPEGTAKIRIFRGRDLLRKRLLEMGFTGA